MKFGAEATAAITELAVLHGNVQVDEAIRRALGTELFLRRRVAAGWRVLMERDGTYSEVVWDGDWGPKGIEK